MAQSGQQPVLRIGTRGSPLALVQARQLRDRLAAAHGIPPEAIALVAMKTTGDAIQDRLLAEAGGKGLFTREIEEALLAGRIDIAVHSAKDMATALPPGLVIAGCLPREDARDAFISRKAASLRDLPQGATLGTASLRRQALAKRLRPDLRIVPLRGNVETRLRKIDAGEADATLLAYAGLRRLALTDAIAELLPLADFPPAVGQGAIALEIREDDAATRQRVAAIDDADTSVALRTERAFLAVLDGSCRTPIAGHAVVDRDRIAFRGLIVRPDGSAAHAVFREGSRQEAEWLGLDAGRELKARADPGFFAHG